MESSLGEWGRTLSKGVVHVGGCASNTVLGGSQGQVAQGKVSGSFGGTRHNI